MDTTTQREQLAQVLATHRTHRTPTSEWVMSNYSYRSAKEWPTTVVLRYCGPKGVTQRAEFPGLSQQVLREAMAEANYFGTNLGGFDLYAPRTM